MLLLFKGPSPGDRSHTCSQRTYAQCRPVEGQGCRPMAVGVTRGPSAVAIPERTEPPLQPAPQGAAQQGLHLSTPLCWVGYGHPSWRVNGHDARGGQTQPHAGVSRSPLCAGLTVSFAGASRPRVWGRCHRPRWPQRGCRCHPPCLLTPLTETVVTRSRFPISEVDRGPGARQVKQRCSHPLTLSLNHEASHALSAQSPGPHARPSAPWDPTAHTGARLLTVHPASSTLAAVFQAGPWECTPGLGCTQRLCAHSVVAV